ncbi:MAG: hypothetical protein HZB26_11665 [Candidatus Hydrogenedentes bacterium]|nr:hypothetical protein [Candidatus Hydrogenedentota bacterium]
MARHATDGLTVYYPFHNLTSYDFSSIPEYWFFTVVQPDLSKGEKGQLDAALVMETEDYRQNYRMLLRFTDVREVIIRDLSRGVDTDTFGLLDIEYQRDWVTPVTGAEMDEVFLRADVRYHFGDHPLDPECAMSMFARDVEVLSIELITECIPGPLLAQPRYIEMLRRNGRREEVG